MKHNLTVTLDDKLLRAARKLAVDRDTSVNQLVRDHLAQLVEENDRRKAARDRIRAIFRGRRLKVGPITWTREQLHER